MLFCLVRQGSLRRRCSRCSSVVDAEPGEVMLTRGSAAGKPRRFAQRRFGTLPAAGRAVNNSTHQPKFTTRQRTTSILFNSQFCSDKYNRRLLESTPKRTMSGEKRQASDEPASSQLVKRPNLGPGTSTALSRYGVSGENGALVQAVRVPFPLVCSHWLTWTAGTSNERARVSGDAAQWSLRRDLRVQVRPDGQ